MGMSHFIMFEAYVEKLAERGHSLTLLTWLNVTHLHKNVKTISFGDEAFHFGVNLAEQEATPKFARIWSEMQFLNNIGEKACSTGLSNIKVKELIKSKQHFDLVVVEFFNTDCFSVFAHFFNAPIIGISSSTLLPWHNDRMGNPDNPSYIVTAFSGYQSEMDFFSRLINTFNLLFAKTYYKMFINGKTDKIIKGNLGKGIPKVSDIVSRTSLYLANSHFSLFQPRPTAPGVIEVGGLHVPQPQRLPPDLDTYLSNSKNGVVYFSMGSLIDSSTLPAKKKKLILNVFGNLTQNVLWKWQTDEMPEKKKNMLVKKWFPQNDVLGMNLCALKGRGSYPMT